MTSDLPSIATAPLPQTYGQAKQALAECDQVDECKDWADKAQALASYARQADDDSLLKLATRIQARAVRRAGELLQEFDGRGEHRRSGGAPTSSQRQAAAEAGMSKDQQVTAVRVANVPEKAFDAAVEGDDPPTVTALAEMGKQARPKPAKLPTVRQAKEMAKAQPGLCVPARDGHFHCEVSDEERELGAAYMALRYDILGDVRQINGGKPLDPALAARAVPPLFAADIARRAEERCRWLTTFIAAAASEAEAGFEAPPAPKLTKAGVAFDDGTVEVFAVRDYANWFEDKVVAGHMAPSMISSLAENLRELAKRYWGRSGRPYARKPKYTPGDFGVRIPTPPRPR